MEDIRIFSFGTNLIQEKREKLGLVLGLEKTNLEFVKTRRITLPFNVSHIKIEMNPIRILISQITQSSIDLKQKNYMSINRKEHMSTTLPQIKTNKRLKKKTIPIPNCNAPIPRIRRRHCDVYT